MADVGSVGNDKKYSAVLAETKKAIINLAGFFCFFCNYSGPEYGRVDFFSKKNQIGPFSYDC